MDSAYIATVMDALTNRGAVLAAGLTETEFEALEEEWGISFPDDLRPFLTSALPLDPRRENFPDWRGGSEALGRSLKRPIDGICFDVEHNSFWYPPWGERPERLEDGLEMARASLAAAPPLIPI